MEDFVETIIGFLSAGESLAGMGLLFVSAAVEYVFPPFPGDTVTLFGAFLCATEGWSVGLVFAVVTGGSMLGASLDYLLGRRLARTPPEELTGRKRKAREKIGPLLAKFERYGAFYVVINRFLPGIRALFFVAAGMARLPFSRVLLFGALSAAAWNALIIAAGFAVGSNWDRLLGWLRVYTKAAWALVGLLAALVLLRWLLKRRAGRR